MTEKEFDIISKLSMINFSKNEKTKMIKELNTILKYLEKLKSFNAEKD